MLNPVEFGKSMAAIVRDAVAPLQKRIEELEARQPEKGEKGDSGPPGKDAPPVEASAVVAELLSGDEVRTMVDLHVAEAVDKYFKDNPVKHGIDGKDGKDGVNGKDGADGRDGTDGKDGLNGIGEKGEPGKPGERGEKGEPGNDGKDGAGIADLLIDRDGALVATMTDGRMKSLGVVVGKDGKPGKDGADLSGAEFDYDGERGLIIRSNGAEIVKRLPIPIDRGYWREGTRAEKGDIYSEGGSAWIANRDTDKKPTRDSADWRMLARKGKDGVDGRNGRDLGPPEPVKLK